MSFPGKRRLKQIKEELWYRIVIANLGLLNRLSRRDNHLLFLPNVIAKPQGRRVLVMAPHCDDETLSIGGTLAKHAEAGDEIKVVFFTDGAAGNPGKMAKAEVVAVRKLEAQKAAQVLGIRQLIFLEYPDGRLAFDQRIILKLKDIFLDYGPELVYLPFPFDIHPDHVAASRLTVAAALQTESASTPYCYEAGYPLTPNTLIDISEQITVKEAAIKCYQSQMAANDYINAISQGLNRFRTHGLLMGKGFAEALFASRWQFLQTIIDKMEIVGLCV